MRKLFHRWCAWVPALLVGRVAVLHGHEAVMTRHTACLALLACAAALAASPPGVGAGDQRADARPDRHGDALPDNAFARLGTTRFRHNGLVVCVRFSPDGTTVASGGGDRTLRVWDTATGKEHWRFLGPNGHFTAIAFSPDGKRLVGGNDDGNLYVWDTPPPGQPRILRGQTGRVAAVSFSGDGTRLVSLGNDDTMRLWDVASGKQLRRFKAREGSVALSQDGKLVAAISKAGTAKLWDADSGRERQLVRADPDRRQPASGAVAFSPDGRTLALGTTRWQPRPGRWEGVMSIRDVKTGKELRRWPAALETFDDIGFRNGGRKLIASGSSPGAPSVRCWDVGTGNEEWRVPNPWGVASDVSADGRLVAMGDYHAIRLFRSASGKELFPARGHLGKVNALAASPDGRLLASGSLDGVVCLWEMNTGKPVENLRDPALSEVNAVAFAPDGKLLAAAGSGKSVVCLWAPDARRVVRRLRYSDRDPVGLAFAPDGQTLAVNHAHSIWLYDVGGRKKPRRLVKSNELLNFVAFVLDGRAVVAGNRLLDTGTGKELRRFGGDDDTIDAASPDGNLVARVDENEIHVRDAATGRELGRIQQTGAAWFGYPSVAFSADGRYLASRDRRVQSISYWDLALGRECWILNGHAADQTAPLCLSPDGRALASGSDDTSILLWDLTTCGRDKAGRLKQVRYSAPDLREIWGRLASEDAVQLYVWMWALAAAPGQAVPFLRDQLRERPPAEVKQLAGLIGDLDSRRFAVRQKAAGELQKLGESAEPGLRAVLAGTPTPEVRRRVLGLLEKLRPVKLRQARAVEVLEHIGTAEARGLLAEWAKRGADTPPAREAKAALARLEKRQAWGHRP